MATQEFSPDDFLLVGRVPVREAIERADIVVMLVDHDPFKALNKSRLAGKVVYDTRGLWR